MAFHESSGMKLTRCANGLSRFLDWRLHLCALLVMAALLPSLWLVFSSLHPAELRGLASGPFLGAFWRTFRLLSAVFSLALVLGWPVGTLLGLVQFPGRPWFLAGWLVPLFTPASLW